MCSNIAVALTSGRCSQPRGTEILGSDCTDIVKRRWRNCSHTHLDFSLAWELWKSTRFEGDHFPPLPFIRTEESWCSQPPYHFLSLVLFFPLRVRAWPLACVGPWVVSDTRSGLPHSLHPRLPHGVSAAPHPWSPHTLPLQGRKQQVPTTSDDMWCVQKVDTYSDGDHSSLKII